MSMTHQVQTYLETTTDIRAGCCERAAEFFGIGSRHICRRLRQEGTTFAELMDQERKRRVDALLGRNRQADVYLVKKAAGWMGTASVTRAMHRWYNSTLPERRAQQ